MNTFKVGDKITFIKKPSMWSSGTCNNCGLDKVSYPYTGAITELKEYSCTIGGYGWCLETALREKCIEITEKGKIKVGDKIKLTKQSGSFPKESIGTVKHINTKGWLSYAIEFDESNGGHDCDGYSKIGHGRWVTREEIELINKTKKTFMTNILSKIKELTRKEPEATFVKAGFMDENENLTEEGKEALQYVIWKNNEKELKELADQLLKKEEKENKE